MNHGCYSELVGAFNWSGRFTTVSTVNGVSVFGIGGGTASFASSTIDQATRAALNAALEHSADVLNACRIERAKNL